MKRNVLFFIWFMPGLLNAQSNLSDTGIYFEHGLTWEQVKSKAQRENKDIFVDCFATWCQPCKQMDKQIYSLEEVGNAYNKRFISIKLQMDSTTFDNADIVNWYNTSRMFQSQYGVTILPTFLFFSRDGNPLHKVAGSLTKNMFLQMSFDALDSTKQFYALVKKYKAITIETSELKGLARMFVFNKNEEVAGKLAADYLTRIPFNELKSLDNLLFMSEFQSNPKVLELAIQYLKKVEKHTFVDKNNIQFIFGLRRQQGVQMVIVDYLTHLKRAELSKKGNQNLMSLFNNVPDVYKIALEYIANLTTLQIYKKENIEFISRFIKKPEDKYFYLFFSEAKRIDKIVGKEDFSSHVIEKVIYNNEINPVITATKEGQTPPFPNIYESIKKKYGVKYANYTVLSSKVAFYKYRAEKYNSGWEMYLEYVIEKVKNYGTDTTSLFDESELNNICYYVFIHSSDKIIINVAIKWMEGVIKRKIADPANSLDTYASLLYKIGRVDEAISAEEKACRLDPENKSFLENYLEMLKGQPTWVK